MTSKLELLEAFFAAWDAFHAIPRKAGRKSIEHEAAAQLLSDRADAVRQWKPLPPTISGMANEARQAQVDPGMAAARAMVAQAIDAAPKDGYKPYP